jgi:hypothetical protein
VKALLIACVLALSGAAHAHTPLDIRSSPLPLVTGEPKQTKVGALIYRGGLVLTANDPRFGGLSGLRINGDGRALMISDAGDWVGFSLIERKGQLVGVKDGALSPVLDSQGRTGDKSERDLESLEIDPDGKVWISFERVNRLWRFDGLVWSDPKTWSRGAATSVEPSAMRLWPINGGAEAVARLPDGRLLIIAEEAPGACADSLDALVLNPATGSSERLSYASPSGFKPTDAIVVGDQLLILHRRFSPLAGMSAIIAALPLSAIKPGAMLSATTLARLVPPVSVDNMEGIAVVERAGRRFVYIVSDNNFQAIQRTLIMKFEWPRP